MYNEALLHCRDTSKNELDTFSLVSGNQNVKMAALDFLILRTIFLIIIIIFFSFVKATLQFERKVKKTRPDSVSPVLSCAVHVNLEAPLQIRQTKQTQ